MRLRRGGQAIPSRGEKHTGRFQNAMCFIDELLWSGRVFENIFGENNIK
jgi:hypothetical protein